MVFWLRFTDVHFRNDSCRWRRPRSNHSLHEREGCAYEPEILRATKAPQLYQSSPRRFSWIGTSIKPADGSAVRNGSC